MSTKLTKPKPSPRPRSIPPESIFSADIFLADNTSSTSSLLFAQNVRISGWSTVGDAVGGTGKALLSSIVIGKGAGAYVVYDVVITTREGTTMHVLKRSTAFERLWGALRRTLPVRLDISKLHVIRLTGSACLVTFASRAAASPTKGAIGTVPFCFPR